MNRKKASSDLAEIWTYFADTSCRDYAPMYDQICRAVVSSDDVLDLVGEAPPRGRQPLLLLAAVHYLLLGGLEHPLAAVYTGKSDAEPGPLFVDVCLRQRDEVLHLLATRHVNTNEVGRSAILGPALTTVAGEVRQPLGLVDVGCSARLNLLCDHYLLDYGPAGTTGPHDAAVRISCEVIGSRPPIAPALPTIAERVGIDRHPVDITNEDETRWLLACVWPGTGRLPRTRLALREVQRTPPRVVEGDAVQSVSDVVLALPSDVAPVVTTTWMLGYLSKEQRIAFREVLAAASVHRPVAWVSAEAPSIVDLFPDIDTATNPEGIEGSVLGLVVFRDGETNARVLAVVHPHGTWIDWRA